MSKTGFVSQMGNDATKTNPRDVLVDESKQADIENLGDCLRALGDGQSLGDFSLTIVLYGRSKAELEQLGPSSLASSPTPTAACFRRPTTNSTLTSPPCRATMPSTSASCIS